MLGEKVRFVTVAMNGQVYSKILLFMSFVDEYVMAMKIAGQHFESQGYDYRECLIRLLEKLPDPSQITMFDEIATANCGQTIMIQNTVSLWYSASAEAHILHYVLTTHHKGREISAECYEDFSIALQKLKDAVQEELHICAYCQQSDFMSDGSEELRHGWYCFRNVNEDRSLPWFQRIEDFEKAIPNVDALHWCPKFCKSERSL